MKATRPRICKKGVCFYCILLGHEITFSIHREGGGGAYRMVAGSYVTGIISSENECLLQLNTGGVNIHGKSRITF